MSCLHPPLGAGRALPSRTCQCQRNGQTCELDADGRLVTYADLELNTSAQRFSLDDSDGGGDLQTVVTHEVGHYIGLSHSRAAGSTTGENLCAGADRRLRNRIGGSSGQHARDARTN